MAGWNTDGVPLVQPLIVNGVTIAPASNYTHVIGNARVDIDTQNANSLPVTVAAPAFLIASLAAGFSINTATSTAAAATLNTRSGRVVTESLTTAVGATYTFVLTNSLLVAGAAAPSVSFASLGNTAGTAQITSITNAVGSTTVVVTNIGTAAFNGTFVMTIMIQPT